MRRTHALYEEQPFNIQSKIQQQSCTYDGTRDVNIYDTTYICIIRVFRTKYTAAYVSYTKHMIINKYVCRANERSPHLRTSAESK